MTETSTYSTLLLTLLMMVGLFFFIRAATKDRTEALTLVRPAASDLALQELTQYFERRAYQVQSADADHQEVKLRGVVRPSLFLALFLTTLAAIGLLCLSLVLVSLFPAVGSAFLGLTVFAPGAGLYYWRRARREEQITLRAAADTTPAPEQSHVTVIAHRDELIALQQALKTL